MHQNNPKKNKTDNTIKNAQSDVLDDLEKNENGYIEETFDKKLDKIKNVLIDKIVVKDGLNSISIELAKKPTRIFELTVRLNGCDVRPCTYTGKSSALNYWELLKGQLK